MRLVIETIDGEKGGHWRRQDLVSHLLPAVIPFLDDPTSIVFKFAVRVIVDRRMTSHYLHAGQLPLLITATLNPNAARYSIYRPTLRVFGTGSLLRTTLLAHIAPFKILGRLCSHVSPPRCRRPVGTVSAFVHLADRVPRETLHPQNCHLSHLQDSPQIVDKTPHSSSRGWDYGWIHHVSADATHS
jgi:hypothetical protein